MIKLTRREFLNAAIGAAVDGAVGRRIQAESRASLPVILSRFVEKDIKPDGDLRKRMWSDAEPVRFDQAAFSDARYPELLTKVASCWSAQFVYLAFWCSYQNLTVYQGEDPTKERWQLWERDVVEAFINPAPRVASHYYEFEVAPNNQWLDLEVDLTRTPISDPRWNSAFEHKTKVDAAAREWTAEMRIPVRAMMRGNIRPHEDWRVNFYRCEGPGDDSSRHLLSWGRLPVRVSGGSFHQPESFGILRFRSS